MTGQDQSASAANLPPPPPRKMPKAEMRICRVFCVAKAKIGNERLEKDTSFYIFFPRKQCFNLRIFIGHLSKVNAHYTLPSTLNRIVNIRLQHLSTIKVD